MGDVDSFLSYNKDDREIARRLGAQLTLAGALVWFDEWRVKAGDSIPGKVNEGLASADSVILIWSGNAARSPWFRAELEAAIVRALSDGTFRVITVRLDEVALPTLLQPLKWVDLRDGDMTRVVNEIMGFANDQDRLRAIQSTLDEARLDVMWFEGYGSVVCCPNCGAGLDRLQGWPELDHERDDTYAGFKCQECGFADGGEI
jgi:hypothetical protein